MRILLAHNSLYFPSHGGGDKSNRLLMEALAARGHEVAVVARIENFGPQPESAFQAQLTERGVSGQQKQNGAVLFQRHGVTVHTVTSSPNIRSYFASRVEEFDPDVIITSTDDPAQLLYDGALKAARAHVMYLIRATIAVPFGPHSAFPSAPRTEALRQADGVVGVSESVAHYARLWAGLDAVHVPISLLDPGIEFPNHGDFNNEFVVMVNPCAVKGVDIFVGLAEALPDVKFAAVPTWGTSEEDWAKLHRLKNLTILQPVDHIDLLLQRTRVMLVPSTWAEARSRIVLEAMAHGVPVMASKIGGLPEAKMGVPYLLPIHPITRYRTQMDANMVPVADVPPQDLGPWIEALRRLTSDPAHHAEISRASRAAALAYASNLTCERFEQRLAEMVARPVRRHAARTAALSPVRKRALELLMQKKQQARSSDALHRNWFSGLEGTTGKLRLFVFPHAGGGSPGQYRAWRDQLPPFVSIIGVRPDTVRFPSMEELIPQLAEAIAGQVNQFYAFFGHSMGAIIAYELARHLRKLRRPLPLKLYVSGARAPHYRLNHVPGPEPSEEEFVEQLRRLEGMPASVLADRDALDTLLPQLTADASLYRRYVYTPRDPLAIPIQAYGGLSDPNIKAEQLEAWRVHTTGDFAMTQFPGGHFYLDSPSQQVFLDHFSNDLALVCCLLSELEATR
ncbi:MAG TPA: thioesterase domain-containing protein [Bryobacteraceae bacterium]|jgi:surfactin synthase thioesterase subunit/glycosyltransferase involved in cell wall biosynthesis